MRRLLVLVALALFAAPPARAQFGGGPPAVGTAVAHKQPVVETSSFIGRVQAIDKVDLVSRVTAFLDEIHFTEGAEVQKGQLLYVLERGPFEADVAVKQAAVAQNQALLRNASLTLARAQALLNTPAGQRATYDEAQAQQASYAAQLLSAQAQLRASQINLAYTEIRAPVAGRITRTNVTVGNVVSPSSGPLATIYSQDPMYVLFPVSVRDLETIRASRHEPDGSLAKIEIRVRLSNGMDYPLAGVWNLTDPQVDQTTDTLIMRATIPNPNGLLIDGQFATAIIQQRREEPRLVIPQSALQVDQSGYYVLVVDGGHKVDRRPVQTGPNRDTDVVITSGLKEGENVIVDGVQKVRPGQVVQETVEQPAAGSRG